VNCLNVARHPECKRSQAAGASSLGRGSGRPQRARHPDRPRRRVECGPGGRVLSQTAAAALLRRNIRNPRKKVYISRGRRAAFGAFFRKKTDRPRGMTGFMHIAAIACDMMEAPTEQDRRGCKILTQKGGKLRSAYPDNRRVVCDTVHQKEEPCPIRYANKSILWIDTTPVAERRSAEIFDASK
jgi:hypothetical protein